MNNTNGFNLKAHELKEGKSYRVKYNGGGTDTKTVRVDGCFIRYNDKVNSLFNQFFGTSFKEEKIEVTEQALFNAIESAWIHDEITAFQKEVIEVLRNA